MSRLLLLPALFGGCAVAEPFAGPLYDDGLIDAQDEYVVAVTYFKMDVGGDVRTLFNAHVADISDAIDDQPGYVGRSLRAAIPGRERWTMTVWTDEQALMDFVVSPAHTEAMADVALLVDSASTTHFTATADEVPVPWDLALAELDDTPAAY